MERMSRPLIALATMPGPASPSMTFPWMSTWLPSVTWIPIPACQSRHVSKVLWTTSRKCREGPPGVGRTVAAFEPVVHLCRRFFEASERRKGSGCTYDVDIVGGTFELHANAVVLDAAVLDLVAEAVGQPDPRRAAARDVHGDDAAVDDRRAQNPNLRAACTPNNSRSVVRRFHTSFVGLTHRSRCWRWR